MKAKRLEIFIIVAIIAVIGIIYAFTRPVSAPTKDDAAKQQVPTSTVVYQGQDGKNALDLLKASHRVDVKHYSFGDMVTGIDGLTPDSSHFWAFYVNDKLSDIGASAYVTKSSDTLKWQMDEINTNQ